MVKILTLVLFLFSTAAHASDRCAAAFVTVDQANQSLSLLSSRTMSQVARTVENFRDYALLEYGETAYREGKFGKDSNFDADEFALGLYGRLKEMGPRYEQLLVDVGLLQHLDQFEAFVRHRPGMPPWVARDEFARLPSLQVSVYRALAVTQADVGAIKSDGMKSLYALSGELPFQGGDLPPMDTSTASHVISRRRLRSIWHRVSGFRQQSSYLMSVSTFPEIASAVAEQYRQPNQEVRLYKIELSKIDLITIDSNNNLWRIEQPNSRRIEYGSVDTAPTIVPINRDVESFVFWQLAPEQIREIPSPPEATYRYIHE